MYELAIRDPEKTGAADPNPDLDPDPYVFGPHGSGSIRQRYGSGYFYQ
jgi:hypothetical protein